MVDDLQAELMKKFDGTQQYARDKRRQTALTQWWGADAANAGVTFASMHPGWAGFRSTDGWSSRRLSAARRRGRASR